jgi:hypothetical protein
VVTDVTLHTTLSGREVKRSGVHWRGGIVDIQRHINVDTAPVYASTIIERHFARLLPCDSVPARGGAVYDGGGDDDDGGAANDPNGEE